MSISIGTGKTTSDQQAVGGLYHQRNQGKDNSMSWGVLDLFRVADDFILALKNFCRVEESHHGAIALGDAKSL